MVTTLGEPDVEPPPAWIAQTWWDAWGNSELERIKRVNAEAPGSTERAPIPQPAPTPTFDPVASPGPPLVATDDGRMVPGDVFMAEARAMAKAANQARQRAHRISISPRLADKPSGKTPLTRSTEYRRVEARRARARKRGLDPDTLGPQFQLPSRKTRRHVRDLRATRRVLAALDVPGDVASAFLEDD